MTKKGRAGPPEPDIFLFGLTQISCKSHHGLLVRGGQSHRVDESLVEGRGENVKVHLVIHGAACKHMVK